MKQEGGKSSVQWAASGEKSATQPLATRSSFFAPHCFHFSSSPLRILLDPPADGPWNMAVDEALLEAAGNGQCTLRFYQWQQPTLSLGYFQSYENRWQHGPSSRCVAVRRASGGGAILHDIEITYSLALAANHPLAVNRLELYRAIHATLIETLTDWGIHATLYTPPDHASNSICIKEQQPAVCLHHVKPQPASQFGCGASQEKAAGVKESFLCFQRRAPGDVLLNGTKIAGSAQRRCRGAVLQHGSILLGQSTAAPELPGINDLSGKQIAPVHLIEAWLRRLVTPSSDGMEGDSLPHGQYNRAMELVDAKYGSIAWTEHRNRTYLFRGF